MISSEFDSVIVLARAHPLRPDRLLNLLEEAIECGLVLREARVRDLLTLDELTARRRVQIGRNLPERRYA